jgi:hypothetical protein
MRRRLWAWLMAHPKPMQPPRRIVYLGLGVLLFGPALLARTLSRPAQLAVSDALWVVITVCTAYLIYVLGMPAVRRKRSRK